MVALMLNLIPRMMAADTDIMKIISEADFETALMVNRALFKRF